MTSVCTYPRHAQPFVRTCQFLDRFCKCVGGNKAKEIGEIGGGDGNNRGISTPVIVELPSFLLWWRGRARGGGPDGNHHRCVQLCLSALPLPLWLSLSPRLTGTADRPGPLGYPSWKHATHPSHHRSSQRQPISAPLPAADLNCNAEQHRCVACPRACPFH